MRKKTFPLNNWRRLSQILCFSLFLFLFIKTDYTGHDQLAYAVNILFRIDPLLALCTSLAAKAFIQLMWPALLTLIFTLIFGRFFCGWACPIGALLDFSQRFFTPVNKKPNSLFRSLKYYLLGFLIIAAFFGMPVAGYFDPFSILVRGLALAVYPAMNVAAASFFTFTYDQAPQWVNAITEPVYAFLRYTVLPFDQKHYDLALLSLAILLTVIAFEKIQRRFFCRSICPLGGLLAVVSKFSLMRGKSGTKCGKCTNCQDICPMGAIDQERNISPLACNLCLDCVDSCPGNKISFTFSPATVVPQVFNLSRRTFIGSLAAGAVLPLFLQTRSLAKQGNPQLIRPPGALPEDDFLGRCVRCGECMKVCIGNALHPTFLESGIEGMFSPTLKARIGYCEYNCTLCGQVCPTGAITELAVQPKQQTKIGNAIFDKNLCLPYAKGIPCIVCEEHCPTPEKAIQFRMASVINSKRETVNVRQPYIVDELCIGCGICETKCPLPGHAAVRLTSAGESRNPQNALPGTSAPY
ncbi:MAG: 4Fe-4S binding protein [Proteobacteria bacterium]|nr:4Fe-4S binding protein [Pseudomonadota bacterium]MBU1709016.1 4Fe-4S binding protein [Pseudomonadota bacterium]